MTRLIVLAVAAAVGVPAPLVWAQSSRQAYRDAYRAWREADPALERDARALNGGVAARASRVETEHAKFAAARSTFLSGAAAGEKQNSLWLQTLDVQPLKDPSPASVTLGFVQTASIEVKKEIASFANDPDRGITQLRQALERERDALTALSAAASSREELELQVALPLAAVEPARAKAVEQYSNVVMELTDAASAFDRESAAWSSYYSELSRAVQGGTGTVVSGTAAPGAASAGELARAPGAPAPVPQRAPSITPLPLIRYTGGWSFPLVDGMYHGLQPDLVDLVVHEESGRATGTFYARFKVPSGSAEDPVVRFDFSGEFQPTRNQVFNLMSSDGAKGTVELIPGDAFNLLEINFQMEQRPGKIRSGDLLLIKK